MTEKRKRKRGRPQKPYVTSKGITVQGLYRKRPGLWRIIQTGKEFTERDEELAVARFRRWERAQANETVNISVSAAEFPNRASFYSAFGGDVELIPAHGDRPARLSLDVDDALIWPWLKRQLLERPVEIADKVGIPQLGRLAELELPRDSVPLSSSWEAYEERKVKKTSLRHVRRAWKLFCDFMKVSTLRECTTPLLLRFVDHVREKFPHVDTARDILKRVRRVVRYGKLRGLDPAEIDAWLSRASVFHIERPLYDEQGNNDEPTRWSRSEPRPIAVEHLDALLQAATPEELAAVLCALNFCLHVSEVLSIRWTELDFVKKVYMSRRRKTGIRRVGVIWDVTERALLALPRTPGPVFKSAMGTAYHPNSFRKIFADLRERAGVPKDVIFDHLRDGAYTGAFVPGVDIHFANAVAGHRLPGEMDKYIAREPQIVRPACDAIAKRYEAALSKLQPE